MHVELNDVEGRSKHNPDRIQLLPITLTAGRIAYSFSHKRHVFPMHSRATRRTWWVLQKQVVGLDVAVHQAAVVQESNRHLQSAQRAEMEALGCSRCIKPRHVWRLITKTPST